MKTILFAGPTLHGATLPLMNAIEMRAPARCGDILKAVKDGAEQIGLIDGLFGDCRSVWHKEILFALSQGVNVFGAASMGALRAAECDQFGMIGIGEVYRDFKNGRRTADSDVAVLHGPQEMGFVPLTIALVDAESTIQCLQRSSAISNDTAAALNFAAQAIGFRRRTWDAVFAASGISDVQARRTKNDFREAFVSLKSKDALTMIDFLADSTYGRKQFSVVLTPAKTVYLNLLLNTLAD